MLHTEPSLSIFNDLGSYEFRDPEVGSSQEVLPRTVTIGETIEAVDCGEDFSFEKTKMGLIANFGTPSKFSIVCLLVIVSFFKCKDKGNNLK